MTEIEHKFIEDLRCRGYAVTIFTPEEVGEADPGTVEDMMTQRGWDVIETMGGGCGE